MVAARRRSSGDDALRAVDRVQLPPGPDPPEQDEHEQQPEHRQCDSAEGPVDEAADLDPEHRQHHGEQDRDHQPEVRRGLEPANVRPARAGQHRQELLRGNACRDPATQQRLHPRRIARGLE
jgi:hypothetical protein